MGTKYSRQMGQNRQMGMGLSEQDILQDMLLTEKYLSEVLNHAILESSNNQTRQMFKTLQENAQEHAQMIYEEMSDQGWYNVQSGMGMGMQQQGGRFRTGGMQQMQNYGGQGTPSSRGRGGHSFQTRNWQTF